MSLFFCRGMVCIGHPSGEHSTPSHNNTSSCLFICTCWLYVCCPWFPKLVLRGTFSPDMWRWTLGHHPWWKTAKPSFDWFPMCHWVSDSIELHLEVKARGWSHGFAAEQRLFATVTIRWTQPAGSLLDPIKQLKSDGADCAKTADKNSSTERWECFWSNMIFTCTRTCESAPLPPTHTINKPYNCPCSGGHAPVEHSLLSLAWR